MQDSVGHRGFVAAQVYEALANYPLADQPLASAGFRAHASGRRTDTPFGLTLSSDEDFWLSAFQRMAAPITNASAKVHIFYAAISEWVARVPGLYWAPGSAQMRMVKPETIEQVTKRWVTYNPLGKSQKVSGGIGTLRFQPDDLDYRLVTLTTSYNASAGVPALISPEVWSAHRLGEGAIVVNGTAHWRALPDAWAVQFPMVKNIPRGCLILDHPDCIFGRDGPAPVLAHPFSVMEYWQGNAQRHDFVYAEADTGNRFFRRRLEKFFEQYRKEKGREGQYLVSADTACPMWDSVFANPAEMRASKAVQLRLIQERVFEALNDRQVIDSLVDSLSQVTDPEVKGAVVGCRHQFPAMVQGRADLRTKRASR